MESIISKIPDLGDKIFMELDNESLVKCKEVQRAWYNFINEEKGLWFKMIQNYIGDVNGFSTAWRKVLRRVPVEFTMQIAIATQQFYAEYEIHSQTSPIHVGVSEYGSLELYKEMMAQLADMNPQNLFGNIHPLLVAAQSGQFEICKHIIGKLRDKNPAGCNGVTPLYEAAQYGHYEICKLIVSNVDDKNPARNDGVTPLYAAAEFGYYEICKLIISLWMTKILHVLMETLPCTGLR